MYSEGLQERCRIFAVLGKKDLDAREDPVGKWRSATSMAEAVWGDTAERGKLLAPVNAIVGDTAASKMDVTGFAVEDPWPNAVAYFERVTVTERIG